MGPRPVVAQRAPTVATAPYFEFQVEKQAQQTPGAGRIRYPDSLRTANVEGEVLAQFVVDENGQTEPGSFKVLKSDHPLFSLAVQTALPGMHFSAAEIGGKKVRQLVQQPFTFTLSKPSGQEAERSYFEFKLTRRAQELPGPSRLRYPDELRAAKVEGEVLAQFVVDETGRVLPGSFKVIKSDHDLFTKAVAAALTDMRFSPAESNDGHRIRQLITQPFTFSLSKE